MSRCKDLLKAARNNPVGLSFSDLCALAECHGFTLARTKGSHLIYKRPGYRGLLNFQDVKGEAKPYQVRQLLRAIEDLEDE